MIRQWYYRMRLDLHYWWHTKVLGKPGWHEVEHDHRNCLATSSTEFKVHVGPYSRSEQMCVDLLRENTRLREALLEITKHTNGNDCVLIARRALE